MRTETKKLIALLRDEDKKKVKKWFNDFDSKSNSINDWQILLGFPLEPHSCQICHRIRNRIMTGLSYYFGVLHLDNKRYEHTGLKYLAESIKLIEDAEPIRVKLNSVYPMIKEYCYKD